MERLTKRDKYGNADIIGVDINELQLRAKGRSIEIYLNLEFEGLNKVTDALNRLATYEDTGLSPEQVLELKERQIPQKRVGEEGYPHCPTCGESLIGEYCYECGQRTLRP